MVTEDYEGSHKSPVVKVQLGRGHIDLCEESALEPREGKAESELLENGNVNEEERLVRIRAIINTYGDAFPAR